MTAIDFGARVAVVRWGGFSLRLHVRTVVVSALLLVATLAGALVALCLGDLPLTVRDVLLAFAGQQSGIVSTVVLEWRAPRVLAAVVFGAALGVSGGLFQSLTRNPLASPDIIGLSAGSYTGALLVIIVLGGGTYLVAGGALVGGLVAAALVYLLAYRDGIQGFRLIVVGIGLSAMLGAVSTLLVLRARLEIAMTAAIWGAGSLGRIGWAEALPSVLLVAVVLLFIGGLAAPMRQLELGDDAARALGIRAEPVRLALVLSGVALTAAVTAFAGPIAFVALAAPQIARRLTGSAGTALVPAGLLGALVLVVSDVVAQHLLPQPLPVGIVTIVVGGGYLVWLLVREARKRP
ncbi:FecCD family ABC transporter permease [Promicromonospora sp. NPDC060271]|uniref:FecCD family ABC transporter permease n=1 Tax=Promicromonospora sp. NPDC060271 TaxID=3347089 RepID=UPI003665CDC2